MARRYRRYRKRSSNPLEELSIAVCDRAMVVTNSTFSRPARILADDNKCVLIGRKELSD